MTDRIIVLIAIIVALGTAYFVYQMLSSPVYELASMDSGIDYSADPLQTAVTDTIIQLIDRRGDHYTITPLAQYQLSGMIVSTRRYRRGFMSWLSPYDYAIIWGNAPSYLPYLKFDQIVRFCLFKLKSDSPVDATYLNSHMGNNHLIPATVNIRKALSKARKKDLVVIEGYLVSVLAKDRKNRIYTWKSSLSRDDKGNGACEIIYVTSLRIDERIYH